MEKRKRKVKIIVRCLSGGVCALFIGLIVLRFSEYHRAQEEYDALASEVEIITPEIEESAGESENPFTVNPKLNGLKEINPDVIGWIEIPDTNIDYPIVQGEDNRYYMEHTVYGTENAAGSIFMEAQNEGDFSDLVTFLYGHRMRDGSMFGNLKYYESEDYWNSHSEIYVSTYEEEMIYDIFSVHRAAVGEETYALFFEAGDAYDGYLQAEENKSWYDTGIEADRNSQVLVLVTCTADSKDERIVVLARKR